MNYATPPPMDLIRPDWPAPPQVKAVSTTRSGGYSRPPYAGLNLAEHVGDKPAHVARNRFRLHHQLGLPGQPAWLRQVHGTRVVDATRANPETEADGTVALRTGAVCAVLTADCMPVLLCDRQGRRVAALHVGWRGLLAGVIETGISALQVPGEQLMAWLGPGIGAGAFEVGEEVRDAFLARDVRAAPAFRPSPGGRWLADMYRLARLRLLGQGVKDVYGGGLCTYSDAERFYSYRRDGTTGRMASLIWISGNS